MREQLNWMRGWRMWRQPQWALRMGLLAALLAGLCGSGGWLAYAFRDQVMGALGQSTHDHGPSRDRRDDPEAASAWFQLSHFGNVIPAHDARIKALQQARRLAISPLGREPRSGGGTGVKGSGTSSSRSGSGSGSGAGAATASGTQVLTAQTKALANTGAALGSSPGTWTSLGPQPLSTSDNSANSMANWGAVTGRVTAVAVDPANGSDVWIGTADGGLWHSTNGGTNWTAVSESTTVGGSPWPTLSIGSIAIDGTTTPHTLYVGTGEANKISDGYWGVGVLKSTDDGATWTNFGYSSFAGLSIGKIAIDPSNHQHLLASVAWPYNASQAPGGAQLGSAGNNVGIWQSTNGGQNWTELLVDTRSQDPDPNTGTDVVFDPANPNIAFAALGNIFHRNNSSMSGIWEIKFGPTVTTTQINGFLPSGTTASDVERVSLAITPDGSKLYAAVSDADYRQLASGEPNRGNLLGKAIYVWTTATSTWSAKDVSSVSGPMWTDDGESQWWFDNAVAVDPTDSTGSTVYVGGVELWKSTDGGTTWSNLTDAYGTNPLHVHPDQHAIVFAGNTSSFYAGNDGGVWSCTGGSTPSCTDLNGGGLDLTQFYGGSIGEAGSGAQLYGGAQDNGVARYPLNATNPAQWNQVYGDDGGQMVVDFTNNQIVYESDYFLGIHKSLDGGQTWALATSGIDSNDSVNFMAPLVADPSNHNALVAASSRVYRTTNGAGNWSAISGFLDNPCGTSNPCAQPISALAVAPTNDAYLYAGDNNGNVYHTTNGGANWSGGGVSGSTRGMVRSLAVDPANPNVVYATFAKFAPGSGGHVFKSTNAGQSWTDISAGLPNIPFASVLVDPSNSSVLFAGSDAGIFDSPNGGSTWYQLGTGLPSVAVDQIFLNHTGTRLFVATHGRGMWEMTFPNFTANPSSVLTTTAPGTSPANQTIALGNNGFGTLHMTLTAPATLPSWLALSDSGGSLTPGSTRDVAAGTSDGLTLHFTLPTSDAAQTYSTNLTFSDPNAANGSVTIPVTVAALATKWYFAEGYTGDSFTEYLTLANPFATAANVQVQYFLDSGGAPLTVTYGVAAKSRLTINVNHALNYTSHSVSMVVTSQPVAGYPNGVPIIAERPMYFTYTGLPGYSIPGGSDVLGATALGTSYDFGYLDTTAGHDTWLTILNQNASQMNVTITYYAANGTAITRTHVVNPNSRGSVHLIKEGLAAGSYSALVSLSEPGLVERPLYLVDGTTQYTGSADVIGVAQPLADWYFAEGYTSASFNERYIVSNPCPASGCAGAPSAHVRLTYYLSSGGPVTDTALIAPGAQHVFSANARLGSNGVNNSAQVQADDGSGHAVPVLAERFISFGYSGPAGAPHACCLVAPGASDVLGAAAPARLFEFAEGYSGANFAEWLTLENPSATQAATVQITYLPSNGTAPTVQTVVVAPATRYTIYTNNLMSLTSFSMQVTASVPIVAERPMYFAFNGGKGIQTGGSDIVGYQP